MNPAVAERFKAVENRVATLERMQGIGPLPAPAPMLAHELARIHIKILQRGEPFGGYDVPEGDSFIVSDVPRFQCVRAINAERGRVNELEVRNFGSQPAPVRSQEYGTWGGDIGVLRYTNAHFDVGGGTNPYASRVVADEIYADDSSFRNNGGKALLRWTRTRKGTIRNLKLAGGPIWLGLGTQDGAVNQLGFQNVNWGATQFDFAPERKADGSLSNMDALWIGAESSNLQFADWLVTLPNGARLGTIDNSAHDITFARWKVRGRNADGTPGDYFALKADDFKNGAQLAARGIQVTP